MKPSAAPPEVVDDPNLNNLTKEYRLHDFVVALREHLEKSNFQNKSFSNITNTTMDDDHQQPYQPVKCVEYCDSNMRHFFEDYKQYHGYVTLIVSIVQFGASFARTEIFVHKSSSVDGLIEADVAAAHRRAI